MMKYVKMCLIGLVAITAIGSTNVQASTFGRTATGGYQIFEEGAVQGIVPFTTTTIQSGTQTGQWQSLLTGIPGTGRVESNVQNTSGGQGRASVTNGAGEFDDGGWRPSPQWSRASARRTITGTNRTNWDLRA